MRENAGFLFQVIYVEAVYTYGERIGEKEGRGEAVPLSW